MLETSTRDEQIWNVIVAYLGVGLMLLHRAVYIPVLHSDEQLQREILHLEIES